MNKLILNNTVAKLNTKFNIVINKIIVNNGRVFFITPDGADPFVLFQAECFAEQELEKEISECISVYIKTSMDYSHMVDAA